MKIEYYFSILSPFAYLGADRFTKIVSKYNLEVIEKPLDLVGEIFPNTGGLPVPKRHPARQKYRLVELTRISNKLGLPINKQPKFFPPKDPHLAAKFLIASNKMGNKLHFGNECLKYLWSMDKDISDHTILQEICEKLNLNFEEMKKLALTDDVNLEYQKNSKDAVDNDVFGSPSYVLNNEIFWGQDRLDYLEDALKK
jgi:2-hydroxychromene-2-carboxylate isomerase